MKKKYWYILDGTVDAIYSIYIKEKLPTMLMDYNSILDKGFFRSKFEFRNRQTKR